MHNAVLITEHAAADLLKMQLRGCDSIALGGLIHRIENGKGGASVFTTSVPVAKAPDV